MNQPGHGAPVEARASRAILFGVIILALAPASLLAQNNGAHTLAPSTNQFIATHDGSIRDIDAIGKRDVGCAHGLASKYTPQEQIEMGRAYAHKVESSFTLITDPAIIEYIDRIGQMLARNSDTQAGLTFKIIDTTDVNAFSLPGGFIYLNSGVILASDNEAELAGVISHEIAHVAACHAVQAIARDQLTNLVSMPRIFRFALRHIAMNTIYPRPTSSFESEADLLGLEYLYKAGYDPQALSSLLRRVKAGEKQTPARRAVAFDSHYQITDRIERSQQEIDTLLPPAPEYTVDTAEFQQIKQRLSEIKSGHSSITITPTASGTR